MKTKKLGKSDLNLTRIGLGTWAIGGSGWDYGWGAQDDKDSIKTILKALELGINWIDTAFAYGFGHAEEVVGKALSEWKGDPIVATKCGLLNAGDGHVRTSLKRESILEEVEGSLKRLQRDVIDIYQIHWPSPANEIEEAFETLIDLKKSGKIRYASVSNFSVKQMKAVSKFGEITSLQPPYSMLDKRVEDDILPYCLENEIGVISYSPMQSGVLTDKISRSWIENLAQDDWRKEKLEYLQEPLLTPTLTLIDKLKAFSATKEIKLSGLAISWVLSHKAITSAIVGARKEQQIEETINASAIELTKEQLEQIDNYFAEYKEELKNL